MGYIKYIPLLSPPLRGKGREGRERERGETGGGNYGVDMRKGVVGKGR